MAKKKIKLIDKIARHDFEIIFGILSGSGVVATMSSLAEVLTILLPKLEPYSFIVYAILYFITFIPILVIYTKKGWFRISYLITAGGIFAIQTYVEIFGPIIKWP